MKRSGLVPGGLSAWLLPITMAVLTAMAVLTPATAAPSGCPSAAEIEPVMLQGRWQIEWTDGDRVRGQAPWLLQLGPHPEYAGSLKGTLEQGGRTHLVVADWDDETLTMEESEDGVRIAATWQASASPGRCGRELRGQRWRDGAPEEGARRFRMRALP